MRHGRAKAARKTLQYFKRTVGLQTRPFLPVLLDGNFVVAMFQQKIVPVSGRIERVLQIKSSATSSLTASFSGESIKYFITQAAVTELQFLHENLVKKKHSKADAFREALEWIRKECTVLTGGSRSLSNNKNENQKDTKKKDEHNDEQEDQQSPSSPAISPQDSIQHHVSMEHDERVYVVATQDEELLDKLRSMGTVPIMRLANHSVLLLEQPSKSSQRQAEGMERQKWKHSLPEAEKALVELVSSTAKKQQNSTRTTTGTSPDAGASVPPPRKRGKGKAKGPNPLSCKRKRTDDKKTSDKISSSKKRRERLKKAKTSD
mmetsp:Transcript_9632/g.17555  ORF Transcript_9632/g.17555 Transcript_9632/m.17555 type:complete len:319 (-) Transcript_9632:1597-2553(-)